MSGEVAWKPFKKICFTSSAAVSIRERVFLCVSRPMDVLKTGQTGAGVMNVTTQMEVSFNITAWFKSNWLFKVKLMKV